MNNAHTAKQRLLEELSRNTYLVLRPSPVEGVGVFAATDIPKGCRDMFSAPDPDEQWIKITKEEWEQLPSHAQFLVGNYCLYDEEHYFVPEQGFKKMDLSYFINHSDTPNIISIDEGNYFEAIRDIRSGEELFLDYGTIVEGEE